MKIVQEKIDKEHFLELSLTPKEFDFLKEYMIISKKCFINGKETNIGVKMEIFEEFDETEDKIYF